MKIIELRAQNIKRLVAVHIRPTGELVEIAGENGAGKTSVLDAIWWGLAGDKAAQSEPIRRGETEASVSIDLGELRLTRKWRIGSKGNRTMALRLERADGSPVSSPQALLDKLVGSLSFEPLAFTRLKPREQRDLLLNLVGLGPKLARIAGDRQKLYDERTAVNRSLERLRGQLDALKPRARDTIVTTDDRPDIEVERPLSQLSDQLAAAQEQRLANDQARAELANAERDLASLDADASRIAADIDRLQLQLAATRTKRDNLAGWLDDARSQVSLFEDPDIESIRSLISQAEEHNAAVRERKVYAAKADELKAEQANSNELTEQIAACERDKADLLKTAAFPIPGLGFSDDGVMFNELPFDQASQAEQIRASVAIGAALQPRLRVMLVKDGSLLDSRGLALLEELARQHDLQVWIERVEPGTKAAVLIEDGIHVVEPDAEPAEVVAGGAR